MVHFLSISDACNAGTPMHPPSFILRTWSGRLRRPLVEAAHAPQSNGFMRVFFQFAGRHIWVANLALKLRCARNTMTVPLSASYIARLSHVASSGPARRECATKMFESEQMKKKSYHLVAGPESD
jgi:hypothetical protein